jgi:hypothetical protein
MVKLETRHPFPLWGNKKGGNPIEAVLILKILFLIDGDLCFKKGELKFKTLAATNLFFTRLYGKIFKIN